MPISEVTKPVRLSCTTSIAQVHALPAGVDYIILRTGNLGVDTGANASMSVALTDGTAAAAGTVAILKLGGSADPGVPFRFGNKGVRVSAAGGLGIKRLSGADGTVSGFVTSDEVSQS